MKNATEEERMGLVTGDSSTRLSLPQFESPGAEDDDQWQQLGHGHETDSPEGSSPPRGGDEKSVEGYEREYELQRQEWAGKHGSGPPPEKGPKEWEGHGPGGMGAFI